MSEWVTESVTEHKCEYECVFDVYSKIPLMIMICQKKKNKEENMKTKTNVINNDKNVVVFIKVCWIFNIKIASPFLHNVFYYYNLNYQTYKNNK